MQEKITAASNPRLKRIAALQQRAKTRREERAFVIEGRRLFLDTPEEFLSEIYCTESFAGDPVNREKLARTGYTLIGDEALLRVSDTQTPQGVLCVARLPEYSPSGLFGADGQEPLLLVLEDVQDPGNLGTMFRTAEAAGATGILMSRGTADVTNPKAVRATMSSVFRVPFCYAGDLSEALGELHRQGIMTCAAQMSGAASYDMLSYKKGTAFLIGNEGNGLRRETADAARQKLKIPMQGKIESLNAAMAAGILLYEAARQRRRG